MSRPSAADWSSVRGYRRISQLEMSTPISNLGADQNVTVGNLGVSRLQGRRWDHVSTQVISASERSDTIGSYDANRGVTIGAM